MKLYGEIFRKFREAKGFSLKQVAGSKLSISQLSRFENGETDLTFSKLLIILDATRMNLNEFSYACHNFKRDDFNELLTKIREHTINSNIPELKKMLFSQLEVIEKNNLY